MIQQLRDTLEIGQRHYFEYGGVRSDQFDLRISAQNTEGSPSFDVEFHEVPGRDGELTQSNDRLKPFNNPLYVTLHTSNIGQRVDEINTWLKTDVRYKEMKKSWDPEYVYRAIVYEYFDLTDILIKFGRATLPFRYHPLKYRADGLEPVEIEDGDTLINPEVRKAKPLINILGTGDITLYLNGETWCFLRAVDQELEIDSEMETAMKDKRPQYGKILDVDETDLYPQLVPGENNITWEGDVSSLHITPRWEAIAR